MGPLRALATVVGLALIVLLVARLPEDVFGATQTALLVAAGLLLLLAAASVFLAPARRLQRAVFLTEAREEAGVFAMLRPEEMRTLVAPVVAALAALAVAGAAGLLRA